MQKSYPSVKTWCAEKFDDLNSFDLSDDILAVFPDEVCRGFEAESRFDLAGDVKETFACFKHELYKAALLMALGVLDEIAHDVEFVTLLSKFAFAKQKGTLADLSEHPIYSNAYLDDFLDIRTKLTKLKAEECTIDKYQAAAAFRAIMQSAKQMIKDQNSTQSLRNIYGDEYTNDTASYDKVLIDERIDVDAPWSKWLCFADCNGGSSALYIDFAPSKEGKKGQIVRFVHDEDQYLVIADSFADYLQMLIEHDFAFLKEAERTAEI